MRWISQRRKPLLVALVILAILAAAFWYGGDAPGSRGWKITPQTPTDDVPSSASTLQQAPETPELKPAPSEEEETAPVQSPEKSEIVALEDDETATPQPAGEQTQPEQPESDATPASLDEADPSPAQEEEVTTPIEDPVLPAGDDTVQSDVPQAQEAQICTLSISCQTLVGNDALPEEKQALVPEDGWLLAPCEIALTEGDSAFDVLERACKDNGIHLEFTRTPGVETVYIEGIGNLYEFDCGSQSGWLFNVDGAFPPCSISEIVLEGGESIALIYTCTMGADVGGAS